MPEHFYGEEPVDLGPLEVDMTEFMHWLYLPVRLPLRDGGRWTDGDVTLPPNLEFAREACNLAINEAFLTVDHGGSYDPYVYLSARRGFATPGNPLNRPGWHCDDFGGTDVNYIWSDSYPTQYLGVGPAIAAAGGLYPSPGDTESMQDFERWAVMAQGTSNLHIREVPVGHLVRLSPYVIHNTPEIPAPGGMRSFLKVSVSTHRYDLVGNSHNYELDYDWPMVSREALRNQPSGGNRDYSGAT